MYRIEQSEITFLKRIDACCTFQFFSFHLVNSENHVNPVESFYFSGGR
jgi:hypothetical protein